MTPTVWVLRLIISTSFNLSPSLHFMERLILSQFVQLVSHPGDYVSSCWEVDYLQIKHFQLLQGDVKFPQTRANSVQVLPVLHWDLGRLGPFSLTGPKMAAAALPVAYVGLHQRLGCPQPLSSSQRSYFSLPQQFLIALWTTIVRWCKYLFQFFPTYVPAIAYFSEVF